MSLDTMYWHDGNLIDVAFALDDTRDAAVVITVEVYPDEQASDRRTTRITCQGVTGFACSLDAAALNDHAGPGHIADGKRIGDTLRLVFADDGTLEVRARSMHVEPC